MSRQPNWDRLQGGNVLLWRRVRMMLEAYKEVGEQSGIAQFQEGGEFHTTMERHIAELRKTHEAQKHSNLTGRVRR